MNFGFKLNTNIFCGEQCSLGIAEKLLSFGFKCPGLIIDEGVSSAAGVKALLKVISESELQQKFILESRSTEEPDYDYLDECAKYVKKYDVDCLVGIGGGSTMDLTKGVAVLMTNTGKGVDYRGMDKVVNASLPTVLLPTTAGTGSEVTFTAAFVDKKEKRKLGINGKHVSAYAAFLDPELTSTCPAHVAVGSGADALVHALEAFMTTGNNSIIFSIAVESIVMIMRNFEFAVNQKHNSLARLNMLVASYLAGITLMYSGGGISGALSYPLGAEYGVPHGLAGGIFIPDIIVQNIQRGYYGYSLLNDRLSPAESCLSEKDRSLSFLNKVKDLCESINMPIDLSFFSVTRKDIEHIVESTIKERKAVLDNNPVVADENFLKTILEMRIVKE